MKEVEYRNWLSDRHDTGDPEWFVPIYAPANNPLWRSNRLLDFCRDPYLTAKVQHPSLWVPSWAVRIYKEARKRAAAKGREFGLSEKALLAMVWRSQGKCEISGIDFDLAVIGRNRRRPFAPSIDRVISTAGYIPSNCRLVSIICNLAMNEWGEEALRQMAIGVATGQSVGSKATAVTAAVTA